APRDALSLDSEDRAGLRALRYAELALAVERRHLDLAAERRLNEGHRHLAQDVVTRSPEEGVLLHLDRDLEIARRTIGARLVPRGAHDPRRARLDAGRDGHRDAVAARDQAAAAARRARHLHDSSGAAAPRAGALHGDGQEALLKPHAAATV